MTQRHNTRGEALAGLRVLVVEDELMISLLIEDALSEQGCVVIGPFSTVPDGLKAAETEAIDFAILDVNVAGTKIYPVAETMEARGIPFFLISGYGLQALPADRPHWRVFSKPFTTKELVAALMEHTGS